MPHQCTTCERTFPDGSKEMLSGCPDCGGNKFQFRPPGSLDDSDAVDERATQADASGSTDEASAPVDASDSEAETSDSTATGGGETASSAGAAPGSEAESDADDLEDRAQTDARSEVVSSDELAVAAEDDGTSDDTAIESEDDDRPELSELREELNDQFESIKIVNPGQYELNLMELYDREEYIISLREDGRYIIEVPENWGHGPDDE